MAILDALSECVKALKKDRVELEAVTKSNSSNVGQSDIPVAMEKIAKAYLLNLCPDDGSDTETHIEAFNEKLKELSMEVRYLSGIFQESPLLSHGDRMEVDLQLKEDIEKMLANEANIEGNEPYVTAIFKRNTLGYCWSCGSKYDAGDNHCHNCGSRILGNHTEVYGDICWECHWEVNPTDKYCRSCGKETCCETENEEIQFKNTPMANACLKMDGDNLENLKSQIGVDEYARLEKKAKETGYTIGQVRFLERTGKL